MTFAFFLESVGGGEWLVLLAVILVVVGPKNLPSAARKIGQIMSQLRRAADEFKRQLMAMDEEVHKAVDEVKQDYMNVGQEVQDTVNEDGTSAGTPDGRSDSDSNDYVPSDVPPASEETDRAIWESYGRDPNGDYGYSEYDYSGETTAEAPAQDADTAVAESSPSEQAVDSSAGPVKDDSASVQGVTS